MPAILAAAALALLMTATPVADALPEPDGPGDGEGWSAICDKAAGSCTVWTERPYPNMTGGSDVLTVGLRIDADCASLHFTLDRPLDTALPASLQIDGGTAHSFYTGDELAALAGAIDDHRVPRGDRPEFAAFAAEVRDGRLAAGAPAAAELVARFAFIKEGERLAVSCPATQRLLAELQRGSTLSLGFYERPARTGALYDWPQLGHRLVEVPLKGLAAELAALPQLR